AARRSIGRDCRGQHARALGRSTSTRSTPPVWKDCTVSSASSPAGERLAFWCAAPAGAQEVLIASAPEQFFVPPYVGQRGWVGVRLNVPLDWGEITALVADAYRQVAPKRLLAQLDARGFGAERP